MPNIREEMPLLARHEGEWHGTYIYLDTKGAIIDQHASVLRCSFPEDGEFPYFQTNDYTWPDGKTEHHEFPASYKDKQIWFLTERIDGHCWEVDNHTMVLTWNYVAMPDVQLYELIYLDTTGTKRTRTWHWLKAGECFQRTIIDERKVV